MLATWLLIGPLLVANPSAPPASVNPSPARVVVAAGDGRAPARMRGPQAKLMARRAAEVVALRNLTRELNLPASTVVKGFRFVSAIHHPDGSATVTVEWRHSP